MFVQTEITPNPNSLKFLPGKKVSNSGPYEITNKDQINNDLVRNILSVNGVEGIFLGQDFISVNKNDQIKWDEIKHIVISLINDFYLTNPIARASVLMSELSAQARARSTGRIAAE